MVGRPSHIVKCSDINWVGLRRDRRTNSIFVVGVSVEAGLAAQSPILVPITKATNNKAPPEGGVDVGFHLRVKLPSSLKATT